MISVIVCTYNRDKYLPQCLDHLKKQQSDASLYEILIIDNKSTDQTAQIAQYFVKNNGNINAKYYLETNQGLSFARNRGIIESNGKIIAFIDDDAFVRSDYVLNLHQYFEINNDTLAVGGKIIPKYEEKEPEWMSKHLLPLVAALDMGERSQIFRKTKFPIGANMAFRKSVFGKYGNFNISLGRNADGLEGGEEKDMFARLRLDNARIDYVPNVVVQHIIPATRLEMSYIRGLAKGVAKSEIKRLRHKPFSNKLAKIWSELIKIGGTLLLSIFHGVRMEWTKAAMLVKFRYWVVTGYFKREPNQQ